VKAVIGALEIGDAKLNEEEVIYMIDEISL